MMKRVIVSIDTWDKKVFVEVIDAPNEQAAREAAFHHVYGYMPATEPALRVQWVTSIVEISDTITYVSAAIRAETIKSLKVLMAEAFKQEIKAMKLNNGNKYWVGDPCYVYPKKEWSKFCDTLPDNFDNFTTTYNDIPFFVTVTAYGDGCYQLTKNGLPVVGELGVDAGLLSIIPEELIQLWGKEEEAGNLGIWVTMDEDCEVVFVERGVFSFGSYEVDTKGYVNEEDDYQDDYQDEDDYYNEEDEED